jgi:hypothetical protein
MAPTSLFSELVRSIARLFVEICAPAQVVIDLVNLDGRLPVLTTYGGICK